MPDVLMNTLIVFLRNRCCLSACPLLKRGEYLTALWRESFLISFGAMAHSGEEAFKTIRQSGFYAIKHPDANLTNQIGLRPDRD